MKKLLLLIISFSFIASSHAQHLKKDGTPDMRYNENKEANKEGCPLQGRQKQGGKTLTQKVNQLNRNKNRATIPTAADLDSSITYDAMYNSQDDPSRFNTANAATITGY